MENLLEKLDAWRIVPRLLMLVSDDGRVYTKRASEFMGA